LPARWKPAAVSTPRVDEPAEPGVAGVRIGFVAGAEERVRGVPMNAFVAGLGDDLVFEDAHYLIPGTREDA
jgi:hypothetical protein